MENENELNLFISHSSKDMYIVNPLLNLLEHLGFNKSNLFCSSSPTYGIPLGEDIYEFLRANFTQKNLYIIYLLSDNYYKSAACLNEMGAAWVLRADYQSVLLPDFNFKDIQGAVNPNKISLKLDSYDVNSRLYQFVNLLIEKFGLNSIDMDIWEKWRQEFLSSIMIQMENLSLKQGLPPFFDKEDGYGIDINFDSDTMIDLDVDLRGYEGKWGGIAIRPFKRNWEIFNFSNKGIAVDLECTQGLSQLKIEIKSGSRNEVVFNEKIHLTKKCHYYRTLQDMRLEEEQLKNITQIVFLIETKYWTEPCNLVLRNLSFR